MSKQLTSPFQVTGWDAENYDEAPGAMTLSRVAVRKSFDGPLRGESTAQLLMCAVADGSAAGYTVMERVSGELDGRRGTFVIVHGGTHTPEGTSRALGYIMPHSGTGELRGIGGSVEFRADETGKTITLDFEFADENEDAQN